MGLVNSTRHSGLIPKRFRKFQKTETMDDNTVPTAETFIDANNTFVPTLYKGISKTGPENFLVSPLSAEIILALTYAGSRGQTAREVQSALLLPEDCKKIEAEMENLIPNLQNTHSYALHLANKMYVKEHFEIREEFRKLATNTYGAGSENIDFENSEEAAKTMNDWVKDQTRNRIQNMIHPDSLDKYTRIILINALYFKADWLGPFDPDYSDRGSFYKTPELTVEASYMCRNNALSSMYCECPKLKAKFLELPFKGSDASMTFVLPNAINGLQALEEKLDRVFLPRDFTGKFQRLEIVLPKFRIENQIDLKPILKNLGVSLLFEDFKADLSGIAGEEGDLVVNEVVQKCLINTNEEGVEAAAVTVSKIRIPVRGFLGPYVRFIADHPFIFYIKVKGVIIFVGRVIEPVCQD